MPVPYRAARYLTLARQRMRLTQQAVAQRMGVKRQALSQLESGGDDIRLTTLMRWAKAVGVDPRQALSTEPYLVDENAHAVHPDLRRHALLTGEISAREQVLAVLLADFPGVPVLDLERVPDRMQALSEAEQRLTESARNRVSDLGVIVVNLDTMTQEEMLLARECIGRARAAGCTMLIHAYEEPQDRQFLNNTEWHLFCSGNTVTSSAGTWTIVPY